MKKLTFISLSILISQAVTAVDYSKRSWFFQVFGREEKSIKTSNFKQDNAGWALWIDNRSFPVGNFVHPTFSQLRNQYQEIKDPADRKKLGGLKFEIKYGRDILYLAQSKEVKGA